MSKSKSGKIKQNKASISRQEILNVAAKMMRDVGYSHMSLRDLAQKVDMKAGSLYYHFSSKDALVGEVMRVGVDIVSSAVIEELQTLPTETASHDRVLAAMHIHLRTLLSASDFSSAHIRCYPFVPEAVRQDLLDHRRSYDRIWTDLLTSHIRASNHKLTNEEQQAKVRHLRHAILGALNWSLEWFDEDRDDIQAYVASLEPLLGAR